jgi:CheY-like chemotaxis protein
VKGRLLIVDDEALLVKRLTLLLADLADEVITASDGQEAIDILRTQTVHCVLCDIQMPRRSGLEVIAELRTFNQDLPFIFLTSFGNDLLLREAAKHGALDFLNKPDLSGLDEVIQRGLFLGTGGPPAELEPEEVLSEYGRLYAEIRRSSEE